MLQDESGYCLGEAAIVGNLEGSANKVSVRIAVPVFIDAILALDSSGIPYWKPTSRSAWGVDFV